MRRITLLIVSTLAALVLLFSYRTSTGGTLPGATSAAAAPGVVPDVSSAPPSGSPSRRPAPRTTTVNGTVAQTRWGPVQIQARIVGKKIIDVRALQRPTGNSHDDQVNAYALPVLRQQVLQAQSARIDGVSGATVTSDGYRESLQAALDAAHLG
ncbi:FMN-binding protein [Paractinoplanes ferrugineus]|uniref:FMN-binding protein n=1 Tax=Paractinoplanes ferrugineus TaxID=113564 RepID=A0A919MMJ0_9ACTN|nr:FMN-binding protein [Actinoplanes ferrugineus]GIE13307.1 FMN-binding protein [Actinoplanes ferrugineus]